MFLTNDVETRLWSVDIYYSYGTIVFFVGYSNCFKRMIRLQSDLLYL